MLFRAACELGALEGDGARQTLASFGEQIGLAFQILDDVLDVTGPPERTGKPRGADLLDGTVTLPLILARSSDPELAALDVREVRTPVDAAAVCDRIAATGRSGDREVARDGPRRGGEGRAAAAAASASGRRSSSSPTGSSSATAEVRPRGAGGLEVLGEDVVAVAGR